MLLACESEPRHHRIQHVIDLIMFSLPPSTRPPTFSVKSSSVALVSGDELNGRYRIEHLIGQGGYGEVVAAYDLREKRAVALKILHNEERQGDPNALARMRQEAEILRAIRHPNIVSMYAIEDSPEGTFLVMELVEGRSISQQLSEEGPIVPERALPLVHQMLSALKLAHEKQILHRDIKPDNILLCASLGGESERVKLVDFGIAKALAPLSSSDGEPVTLVKTRVGDVIGTPRYAAPEQVVGDPTGPPADLFSLGLVIAEWLTGVPRVKPGHYGAVMAQLVVPTPFDVSDCPPAWQSWLLRMMDKSPNGRFRSAEEALAELELQVPLPTPLKVQADFAHDMMDTLAETRTYLPPESLQANYRAEAACAPLSRTGSRDLINSGYNKQLNQSLEDKKKEGYSASWGVLLAMVGLISCLLLFIIYRAIIG